MTILYVFLTYDLRVPTQFKIFYYKIFNQIHTSYLFLLIKIFSVINFITIIAFFILFILKINLFFKFFFNIH